MLWLAQIPKSQPQPLTPGSEKHKAGLPQGLGHHLLGSFQHTRPTLYLHILT